MQSNRRNFIRTAFVGGAAAFVQPSFALQGSMQNKNKATISVGEDHTQNIINSLKPQARQIKAAIANRKVIIKPNNVSITNQLSATHADSLTGIIEFLKSIGVSTNDMVIAESAASGPTLEGFENYGYNKINSKYGVDLVDLDQEPIKRVHVISDKNFHPVFVRMSKLLLDPETFVISAAVMKTHDRVVTTLSLKNIIFGAPIKDVGFRWGGGSKKGARNDKPVAHGGGYKGVNYNLFQLAPKLGPDLAVIDGFQGMEGNGPVGGTPVDHKIAVSSLHWYSADRTALELMGIDVADVGYMNYCAQAGMGEIDVNKIQQLGEPIKGNIKKYKLSTKFKDQLMWKET
jgi:uncharacterized protein (DUF362 family)